MLRQVARRAILEAHLSEPQFTNGPLSGLANILNGLSNSPAFNRALAPAEVDSFGSQGVVVPTLDYGLILKYLRSTGQVWYSHLDFNIPFGAFILPPYGQSPLSFDLDKRTYSVKTSHPGNSAIQFKLPANEATTKTGHIKKIWQFAINGHVQTIVAVEAHKLLRANWRKKLAYETMPLFNISVVESNPSRETYIIEPRHILTHVTVFKCPADSYGVKPEFMLVCTSLNRGRRA